jgi:hypothetical protein
MGALGIERKHIFVNMFPSVLVNELQELQIWLRKGIQKIKLLKKDHLFNLLC